MLEDMGLDMSTYIIASVKALVREKRIPFEMATTQFVNDLAKHRKLPETRQAIVYPVETSPVQLAAEPPAFDEPPEPEPSIEINEPIELPMVRHAAVPPRPERPPEPERTLAYPTRAITVQHITDQTILERLAEARSEFGDPTTRLYRHEEIFGKVRERNAYEI